MFLSGDQSVARHTVNGTISRKRQRRVNQIGNERENHRNLVADAVNEQAKHDNADAEGPDTRAHKLAHRNLIEAVISCELRSGAKNDAADEGVAGGGDGDKTTPKKNFVVTGVHGYAGMVSTAMKLSTEKNGSFLLTQRAKDTKAWRRQ